MKWTPHKNSTVWTKSHKVNNIVTIDKRAKYILWTLAVFFFSQRTIAPESFVLGIFSLQIHQQMWDNVSFHAPKNVIGNIACSGQVFILIYVDIFFSTRRIFIAFGFFFTKCRICYWTRPRRSTFKLFSNKRFKNIFTHMLGGRYEYTKTNPI